MDIEEDQQVPIILGSSFMRTVHEIINVHKGVYRLREGKKQMSFKALKIFSMNRLTNNTLTIHMLYVELLALKKCLLGRNLAL